MSKEMESLLEVNPLTAVLTKYANQGGVAKLSGWVGASESDNIRLYQSLAVTRYLDIPRKTILHVEKVRDRSDGQIDVYLPKSTKIMVVEINSMATTAGDFIPTFTFRQVGGGSPGMKCAQWTNGIRAINSVLKHFEEVDDALGTDISDSSGVKDLKSVRGEIQAKVDALCS